MLEEPETIRRRIDEIVSSVKDSKSLEEMQSARTGLKGLADYVAEHQDAYRAVYGEQELKILCYFLSSSGQCLGLLETVIRRQIQKSELERRGYKV
jgi:hypothetical protein